MPTSNYGYTVSSLLSEKLDNNMKEKIEKQQDTDMNLLNKLTVGGVTNN